MQVSQKINVWAETCRHRIIDPFGDTAMGKKIFLNFMQVVPISVY